MALLSKTTFCLLVFPLLTMSFSVAHGAVVGMGGTSYPIKERDMLELIEERIASIDQEALLKKMQERIQNEARTFRPKDAVEGLPIATKAEIYNLDLSYTLTQPIYDLYGKVMYPAGYTFNPLELMQAQGIHYPFVIVVLNAERKAELDWFISSGLNDKPNVKLWVSEGYAYELAEKLKRPVYYLSSALQTRFTIKATPSMLYWPEDSKFLKVRTVAVSDVKETEQKTEE